MIKWNDLDNTNNRLYRKPGIEAKYIKFVEKIKNSHYKTMSNYIKKEVLNRCPFRFRNDNDNDQIYITINDYPYHTEKNVSHWIIWDLKGFNKKKYYRILKKIFNPRIFEIKLRINKIKDRSILDICHTHLFIKLKL